jgi:DNA mismatch repair protein MSH2
LIGGDSWQSTDPSQDFFSAHGSDAILVAHQIFHTLNVVKYLGPGSKSDASTSNSAITAKGLPSVTISMTLTKAFLRECLTTKQMRIEIYEPDEGMAGRKNHSKWVLGKSASPGNVGQVEDLLFSHEDMVANAVSMSIKIQMRDGGRVVGCAFVDVQEKRIGVSEFVEDENFGNTEVSASVSECSSSLLEVLINCSACSHC